MKFSSRFFLFFSGIFIFSSNLWSAVFSQPNIFPQKLYVGDDAILTWDFNFEKELNSLENLQLSCFKNLNSSEIEIKRVSIQKKSEDFYTMTVEFSAWKTGKLLIPSYDIALAFNKSQEFDLKSPDFDFVVSSLLQNENEELRSFLPPLLLPGTTYRIWIFIVFFAFFLFFIIKLILNRKKTSFWIKNLKLKILYKKNQKKTLKSLELAQKINDDSEFAEKIQFIIRNYLEVRFDFPFTKFLPSEISNEFYKSTFGLLDEKKYEEISNLCGIIIRCDFVRFAKNSKICKDETNFSKSERNLILEKIRNSIKVFEKNEIQNSKDEKDSKNDFAFEGEIQ